MPQSHANRIHYHGNSFIRYLAFWGEFRSYSISDEKHAGEIRSILSRSCIKAIGTKTDTDARAYLEQIARVCAARSGFSLPKRKRAPPVMDMSDHGVEFHV